ncbi:MAG: heme A synthase [Endozoicomonadaceae bacterium]|nr:heme A synthase [Endozoicomonadaceae bacterium]
MMHKANANLFWLAACSTVLAFFVVGLGAYTRLMHAGLGCPDWPGCYGFLTVPNTSDMLAWAQQHFPNSPVDPRKGWPEMIHRYAAGFLMLCVLALNAFLIKNRKLSKKSMRLGFFILLFITLQAAFGMWTVTLKLWPQVVTAHLIGGFTTLSLLFLLTKQLYPVYNPLILNKNISFWLILSIILVVLQIVLGGWLSANYAAIACPDFPQCQGQWIPSMDFSHGFNLLQSIGPDYLGGRLDNAARTAIHFSHRLGALFVLFSLSMLCYKLYHAVQTRSHSMKLRAYSAIYSIVGLLGLQMVLGISNVLLDFPLHIALTHNLIGACLLLSLISLAHAMWSKM